MKVWQALHEPGVAFLVGCAAAAGLVTDMRKVMDSDLADFRAALRARIEKAKR